MIEHLSPRHKGSRFLLVGGVSTGNHVIVAAVLIEFFQVTPPISNGIAFTLSTLISYLLNTGWSFSQPFHQRNFVRFISVSIVGLVLSMSIATIAQSLGMHYLFGILAIALIVPLVTFALHSRWTYK